MVDLDRLTGALSPRQIVSLHESTARINIWEGSIRSGKTIASLLRWLLFVITAPRGGELVMFGKTRQSVARNLFGPLQDPSLFGPLTKLIRYTPGADTAIIFGRTVHIIGANDAKAEPKVRGMTVVGAYGDELTVIPEAFFRQILGRMSVPGAQLFGSTNPDNPAHWLRQGFLLRGHELDLRTWHFTLDDNPHLPAAYVAAIKAEFTGLWYRRFVLGHWVASEGAIYEAWDETRHVVDEVPPIASVLCTGIDYGTTNPFAALTLAVTKDGRLVFTRSYRHDPKRERRQLTDAEFSTALTTWLDLDQPRPPRIVVDPSAESFQLQLRRDGVRGVVDADNSVLDGIRLVASLLATGRLLVHRSCRGFIDEAPGYSWDDTEAMRGVDKPIKVADHDLDAGRYAVKTTHGLWRHAVPITPWTPPPARRFEEAA